MRTMKAFLAVVAVAVALAPSWAAAAADVDAGLYADTDTMPSESTGQRSLQTYYGHHYYQAPPTYSPRPTYKKCYNAHIPSVFTAKVAVLAVGKYGKYAKVDSTAYANIIRARIQKRLDRYNKRYRLHLSFGIVQKTAGCAEVGKQKFFFYDITFYVGKCGQYKYPLVTQLRGEIQPSAPFIKLVRVLDYPAGV